jgi:hypothetical protein
MGNGQLPGSTDDFDGALELDDGTGARTETPPPGPIGMDAPSGGGTSAGIGDRILGFARRQRGSRVGNGECFTFADRALDLGGPERERLRRGHAERGLRVGLGRIAVRSAGR